MNVYNVEIRTEEGKTKTVQIHSLDHAFAKLSVEHKYKALVLSTEFVRKIE